MSIFSKLFKKTSTTQKAQQTSSYQNLATDPNLIRGFDKYGQELFITKDEWRTNVLPHNIEANWNQPEELYGIIVNALNDGLDADVLDAAAQLYSIDPLPVRGSCLYAIVLMKNGRLDEAERVLKSHLEKHGEEGVVLTNLAKVYAERNQMQTTEETLWHALEVDPNQDNGLDWYQALQHERGGADARLNALERIAALPGSWRAQIWLARAALESGNLKQALDYYHESLSRVGESVPADLLMQMSGDLGNHGHVSELIEVTEPHFVVESHGLQTGNNLIKAHLQLGHHEQAQKLVDQLYSLKRPDWRETLSYWDTEIAKARVAGSQPKPDQPFEMQMLTIEAPVWLDRSSPLSKLFQFEEGGPTIAFLGGSAEVPNAGDHPQRQMPDSPGRMSRALPLFLAEQVSFTCQARARTWLPWIPNGGFVLSGQSWTDANVVQFGRQVGDKSDYVVAVHLKTESQPWQAELRLLQAAAGQCLATLEGSLSPASPEGILDLAHRLTTLLAQKVGLKQQANSPLYQLPETSRLADYLLREEQFLAVRCARMDTAPGGFLHGGREIIEGNLQLCLACPKNSVTRILLAQTLLTMNKVKPEVVNEFIEKVEWLQKEHPLSEPVQAAIKEMLLEARA